ncbi:hypothetical protein Pelo_13497 [Pelomyxa schiedti]|nr:hypothetical protein Pelo_13497 [Pelomyxa schiedti]
MARECDGMVSGPELSSALSTASALAAKENLLHNSEALATIHLSYGVANNLIKWAINEEIKETTKAETLFRNNSLATRMMNVYYRKYGRDYLRFCLGPFFSQVTARDFNLQLSGHLTQLSAPEGVDLNASVTRLTGILQDLCDKIFASKEACPMILRQIFHHVYTEVAKKSPQIKTIAVGGFLFLRFLCPAVLTPDTAGILPEKPNEQSMKTVMMISTLLQKLANGVEFANPSSNEQLSTINKVIARNIPLLLNFLDQISVASPLPDSGAPLAEPEENQDEDLNFLLQQVTKGVDLIVDHISKKFPSYDCQLLIELASNKKKGFDRKFKLEGSTSAAPSTETTGADEEVDDGTLPLANAVKSRILFFKQLEDYCESLHSFAERESTLRRAAEAENRLLRNKIRKLEQQGQADVGTGLTPDVPPEWNDPITVNEADLDLPKKRVTKIFDRIQKRLDELYLRTAESEAISEIVYLSKLAREMSSLLQSPLCDTYKQKSIPYVNIAANQVSLEKSQSIRKAALLLIQEVKGEVNSLGMNLPFMFRMYDLDRRIGDLFKLIEIGESARPAVPIQSDIASTIMAPPAPPPPPPPPVPHSFTPAHPSARREPEHTTPPTTAPIQPPTQIVTPIPQPAILPPPLSSTPPPTPATIPPPSTPSIPPPSTPTIPPPASSTAIAPPNTAIPPPIVTPATSTAPTPGTPTTKPPLARSTSARPSGWQVGSLQPSAPTPLPPPSTAPGVSPPGGLPQQPPPPPPQQQPAILPPAIPPPPAVNANPTPVPPPPLVTASPATVRPLPPNGHRLSQTLPALPPGGSPTPSTPSRL